MALFNFQKPDKVIMIDSTDFEGKFEFRPLEPGYGLTVGNALRRVLLSSLEGFAITSVRIEGVDHEFSAISGVVEDVTEIEETIIESTESNQNDKIAPVIAVADVAVEEVDEDVEVPFSIIEDIPVFPGCEKGTKIEKRNCFQLKMEEHVAKNFRYPEQALDLGIQGKVFVIFIIDKDGFVSSIRSRGPDKILEKEAERIIGLLPKMIPGKQRGKPVKVPYSVPIIFKYMAS